MKILISGVCGSIGSILADSLLKEGHFVCGIDNLSSGSLNNIENIKSNNNFNFIYHDIVNPINIDIKFDQIYHLGSPASPKYFNTIPLQIIRANVNGSDNMLQKALKDSATILFTSTSEIYGDALEHPQKETYWGNVNPIGPRANYDNSKRCGETLFYTYNKTYGVKTRIIRFFNVFSPKLLSDDGRVISNFINQALKNEPITIYGDGTQTRSFMYIDDAINGVKAMMNNDNNFLGPVNLGNPLEHSIHDLANIIIKLTRSTSKLIYKPLPKDDPKQRNPDISLAKEMLNWEPTISLEEGLIKTIEYFKLTI